MGSIVLVDDDEIERAGRQVVLAGLGHEVEATGWTDLAGAGHPVEAGRDVDLAILVVRRDLDRWDRYQALRSVGDLRPAFGAAARIVAVVEGPSDLEPLLGVRLARAGVGEQVGLRQFRTAGDLDAVVSGVRRGADPMPTADALAWSQIGTRSNPARVIDRVLQMAEDDPSYLRAFEPGVQQNHCGLSRRRAHTLRVKVAELGDLHPAPGRSTGGPVRDQSLPRWSEVVAFVNRCRGWDPDDDLEGGCRPWGTTARFEGSAFADRRSLR